jgi:nucleolar pre-ribosomal-associated protein 2
MIAQLIHYILDSKTGAISQWTVEVSLSMITRMCTRDSLKYQCENRFIAYDWLCRIVEVIIKKHRLRVEGHYHLLMTTLEALLRALLVGPGDSLIGRIQPAMEYWRSRQESNAIRFSRLVSLTCEPSAAAVVRSRTKHSLDSATNVAKRSAGRHMYLLLLTYVKLQLEIDVSGGLRDALEPGFNSVFDVTPTEVRKILNDGMDSNGRALLREMFKRYSRFGKWSGI